MILILSVATILDFRCEKIPNELILIGLLSGIFRFLASGLRQNIGNYILGIFLPLILFFPFFAIKAFGAGDIKLLMLTGSFLGSKSNLRCIGVALLAAAMVGLVRSLTHTIILSRFDSLFRYMKNLLKRTDGTAESNPSPYLTPERKAEYAKIHFSLYVLIGAALTMAFGL